jgi:hypothetical protein
MLLMLETWRIVVIVAAAAILVLRIVRRVRRGKERGNPPRAS